MQSSMLRKKQILREKKLKKEKKHFRDKDRQTDIRQNVGKQESQTLDIQRQERNKERQTLG